LLRKITGAHLEEICCLMYNDYLSLMATGSVDGEICVWDFEMSKIEGFCLGHSGGITGIEFVAPYPIMVTSSMDGTVCVWGVRPCPIAYKHICLYRFTNISWRFDRDQHTAITKICVIKKTMTGIKKYNRAK
jgi:WD40 repeat protein